MLNPICFLGWVGYIFPPIFHVFGLLRFHSFTKKNMMMWPLSGYLRDQEGNIFLLMYYTYWLHFYDWRVFQNEARALSEGEAIWGGLEVLEDHFLFVVFCKVFLEH